PSGSFGGGLLPTAVGFLGISQLGTPVSFYGDGSRCRLCSDGSDHNQLDSDVPVELAFGPVGNCFSHRGVRCVTMAYGHPDRKRLPPWPNRMNPQQTKLARA